MQENNFENEVRQRLEALSLTPSEPVWQNVEAALQKKRGRRRVLWLLPMLLAGGGFFWWAATQPVARETAQQAEKTKAQLQTFSKPHMPAVAQKQTSQTGQATTRKADNITTAPHVNQGINATEKNKIFQIAVATGEISERVISARKNKPSLKQKKAISTTKWADIIIPEKVTPNLNRKERITIPASDEKKGVNLQLQKDSAIRTPLLPDSSFVKSSTPPKIIITKPKRRLQWSLAGRAGTSNLIERWFGNGNGMLKVMQRDAASAYNNRPLPAGFIDSTSMGNGAGAFYKNPSLPQKGAQFSIGLLAKKRIGKNRFVTLGFHYSSYRSHLSVGSVLQALSVQAPNSDRLQQAYKNNGATNRFTNKLHFIELPIGFEYRLLKKQPLYLQHGVLLGRLLKSRVLQYDSHTNAYYQDVLQVNKTGVALFTMASYTVWQGRTVSLQAGPQVQYGLSNLFETSGSPGRLFSGGLAVNMGF